MSLPRVEAQVRQARDALRRLQETLTMSAFAEAIVNALEAIATELEGIRRELGDHRPRETSR
jgi:hypothetical protein